MPKPQRGTVASIVSWLVSHGRDIGQIFARVIEKFPHANLGRVSDLIDKFAKLFNRNVLPGNINKLSSRQQAQLAKTGKTKGFTRCTVEVTWTSPNTGEVVDGSWWVDVPDGLSGNQLRSYIYNSIYNRFNDAYGGSAATLSKVAQFVHSVDYTECK